MTRLVTLRDVAREAGVSAATVSNAINRPARVAAETRTKVLKAANTLGYVPLSGSLRPGGKRSRIGVIAPLGTYSSYGERLAGALSVLGAGRVDVLVYDHPSASRSISPRLAALPFSDDLDGLIIMGIPIDTEFCDLLLARRMCTVLVDSHQPKLSSITLNEAHGATLAAQHLLDRGFERFVYVTEGQLSQDFISHGRTRMSAFIRALTTLGVPEIHIQRVTARAGDAAAGGSVAAHIASTKGKERVGVLAGHDLLASGIIRGLRQRGTNIPTEVGVMGWDGGDLVESLGLTTIRQPLAESGRLGAELLVAQLRNPQRPVEHVTLTPLLREGGTT